MNRRIVHVSLDVMRKMDKVVGIAGRLIKAEAILGALSDRLINVLVTDDTLLPRFTGATLRDGVPVGRRLVLRLAGEHREDGSEDLRPYAHGFQ